MINRKPKELAPKLWVDVLIFLSAYYPLFLILLILDIGPNTEGLPIVSLQSGLFVSKLALGLFLLSSVATLLVAHVMRKLLTWQEGGKCVQVRSCTQVHGDMLNYTIPFLMGLFAFNYQSLQSIAALVVFLVFMLAFVRSDRVMLLNAMFLLLGIRLYELEYHEVGNEHLHKKRALCWGELVPSQTVLRLKLNTGIHFLFPEK